MPTYVGGPGINEVTLAESPDGVAGTYRLDLEDYPGGRGKYVLFELPIQLVVIQSHCFCGMGAATKLGLDRTPNGTVEMVYGVGDEVIDRRHPQGGLPTKSVEARRVILSRVRITEPTMVGRYHEDGFERSHLLKFPVYVTDQVPDDYICLGGRPFHSVFSGFGYDRLPPDYRGPSGMFPITIANRMAGFCKDRVQVESSDILS